MTATLPMAAWPPFPIHQLPSELHGLLDDFQWAAIADHPTLGTTPLLTVVVPCFDPDPLQFSQLLLSLHQQSDQVFHLLLVNDGSSVAAWAPIQALLDPHPWIQVLHQPANTGVSAALNAALDLVATPYVALVDQDDILHPGALALVRQHLEAHSDCGLLYSDHLVFDDLGMVCQYIPKFPWNPEALLEFNYLIHLTVVRSELYRDCGGMDSRFDGIQDWEFYLRLVPHLANHSVGYLPVPLYAWRLSENSLASSAQPKELLLELSQQFLAEAHGRWGSGTRPVRTEGQPSHYRFLTDRAPAAATTPIQPCHLLVFLRESNDAAALTATLESVAAVGLPIARVFVAHESSDFDGAQPVLRQVPNSPSQPWPEPELLSGSLLELPDQLPTDAPLLVLQAGVRLCGSSGWLHLAGWLERTEHCDLLTLPGFESSTGICVSAGYSSVIAHEAVYFPQGQDLTREAYAADFASFGHTRSVDLPSPAVQLLGRNCLADTLEQLRRLGRFDQRCVSFGWWSYLASLSWRCFCPPDLPVELPPVLVAAERFRLAVHQQDSVVLTSVATWLATQREELMLAYGTVLSKVLAKGPGRIHPLHALAWLAAAQHPATLQSAQRNLPRLSLLPQHDRRPLVMLIPTELNARSHGHACMLTLAMQLQAAGNPVYLLPFKPYTFFRDYLKSLPDAYRQLTFIADPLEAPSGVLLVPESAPPKLVRRLRSHYDTVLWWLLAPPGLLTNFSPDIRLGDSMVAFSEFALPRQLGYLFVNPPLDAALLRCVSRHSPQPPCRPQVALYTGKGRIKPLPRSLHRQLLRYQVVVITRAFPATREKLVEVLSRTNGLISFDPLTNLSLEAALLGVPTFLPANPFPIRCFRQFPVDLRAFLTTSPGEFIRKLKSCGPVRKLSPEPLNRMNIKAASLVDLLTAEHTPYGALAYRVTHQTLRQIRQYRHDLVRSRAVQVARDGQSFSSAYAQVYALSIKMPYTFHCFLCQLLACFDRLGDLLIASGFFRLLRPLVHLLDVIILSLARRFGRAGRLLIR